MHESAGFGASADVGRGITPDSSGGRKRQRPGRSPEDNGLGGSEGSPLPRVPLPRGPACVRFQAIDERMASTLSYEDFIETYALRGRPVVLKGGASLCFEEGNAWSREALRVEAGHKVVPVRRWVPDSVSWARLEKAGQMPLERLLSQPATDTTSGQEGAGKGTGEAAACGQIEMDGGDPLYLHDWSLPQNLGVASPLLAGKFRVPKFFAGDLLQRLAGRGLPYTDSWPSLFIGPKGSRSDTHIDSFGSHFWMALLEGKKRWLLYPKEEAPLLYPIWPEGCHDPVFEADLDNPDATRTPAALLAKGFSCVLEAGDLLFVPAGCPHRVENLTGTLALSCNYVDATNIDMSLAALQDQAFTDPQAAALASALGNCNRKLARRQEEVPWTMLKKWPREGEVAEWLPNPRVQ
ncbi:conserved unknown protein [Ectocarpus siliculosus]|uniref:JmjC domain-containing protein n=1 Tax=Ectocarpus siliculosus TaxID=2880 RepID=D8LCT9_ECTSI|nr:conserved unknown protein [Ectocarpus siliculosus]|eukprot:CBN75481.1 conserved unknown protein [Ectocarpus siliculosus]